MIRIEPAAWTVMVDHAQNTFPNECCGAMLGSDDGEQRVVTDAVPLENAFAGQQFERYEIRPEDLIEADREANRRGLVLVGIYHSHPDCDAYFSRTDLENSSPWHSFVVLSIKSGRFDHANCFRPDLDRISADREELQHP
ncbi:MAG TPA: M67 family metallopeptidase [Bryobacteraceae bacterium]|nr:M67 family metallopeptidase [Bryobacteraceae bacterium]